MAVIRWQPVPMNRLITSLFDTPTGFTPPVRRFVPATDIVETDTHYVLRADLPGVAEEDLTAALRPTSRSCSERLGARPSRGPWQGGIPRRHNPRPRVGRVRPLGLASAGVGLDQLLHLADHLLRVVAGDRAQVQARG